MLKLFTALGDPGEEADRTALAACRRRATHDPSTSSYGWALGLQSQIPGSTLFTRDGDGHTSYMTSECSRAAIDGYLVDLALPPPGTVCTDP